MRPFFAALHSAIHRHHPGHHGHHGPHDHSHDHSHDHPHAAQRGRHGFAGFGGRHGFPGDPFQAGIDGLHHGRKLGSADLQLLLLALLAERPSHGYELIKALEERSKGYYSPSPGMVYPALTYLEEIGYASLETQGTKKLYSVTVAGLAHLEEQRSRIDALLEQLAWIGSRMEQVRQAMAGAGPVDGDEADFDSPHAFRGRGRHHAGAPEVRAARRSLKSALIEKSGASAEEQRRIAKVLERAAAEIRGEKPADA